VQKFIESLNYDTNIVLDLSGLFLSQAVRERDQIQDNAFLRQPVAELDAIAMNQAVCMHPAAPENEAEGIRTEPYWSRGVQASIRTPGRLETPAALRAETRRCRHAGLDPASISRLILAPAPDKVRGSPEWNAMAELIARALTP
jgi:hypothetical protein